MNILKFCFITLILLFYLTISFAQIEDAIIAPDSLGNTIISPIDTLVNPLDTLQSIQDSIRSKSDSIKTAHKSSIETTIDYSATDSINIDDLNKIVKLYGDAKIVYGDIELEAARIEINYKTQIMTATSYTDSLGEVTGKPIFKDGGETYYTEEIAYNFKSEKAISKGVVTQQGDANMRGTAVYKNPRDELFIQHAIYTTCNRPEPHFHIQTEKIKLLPNNKVVSGPGYIAVKSIPTPIGFPFGIFPMPNKKASGIIVPSYGEEKRRGFYLRGGGYYFAINDYMDLEVLGDIYSTGSWGVSLASSYIKRYAYSGRVGIRYNNQTGQNEYDSTRQKDFWVNWSHSPQSKGNSRFSASASFGTSSYNQNNPTIDASNTIKQDYNSSVSYSTTFRGTPFSLSVRGRFQQNVNTKVVNLLLPETSLSMNRIYPFKNVKGDALTFLQKLSFSWNMNSTNRINNDAINPPSGFEITDFDEEENDVIPFQPSNFSTLMERAQNGVQHRIPISTTVKALKFFTFNPSFNYDETWYFKKLNYEYIEDLNAVDIDTLSEFSRLYRYNFGASLNTNIYGLAYFKNSKIQAIRHVMRPSVSMSFAPDFSDERFNYYQEVQIDSLGNKERLSRYDGFVYGTPTAGKNASLSFSLANNLEMKVKSKKDSINEFTKVAIFENLSMSTSYNFLADSFNLSNITMSARTKLFKNKLDVSLATTIDPYIYQLDSTYTTSSGDERVAQKRRDIYAWNNGQGIGQVSNARLGLTINLKPPGAKDTSERIDEMDDEGLTQEEQLVRDFVKYNPELYVDFEIPWSLNINYNISYTKRGFEDAQITQVMRFSGQITLTEFWNVGFTSGFDFERLEFTQTNFRVSRDLHCWQMSFNWTPFGRYESYNLTINAKSSLLQDLKVNKQQSWFDN